VHQPQATARALQSYLTRHPEYDAGNAGRRIFLSTGFCADVLPLVERFWGEKLVFGRA
jgi:glutamate racemase